MIITQDQTLTPTEVVEGDWQLLGEVDVSPSVAGKTATFELGFYERTMPEPKFVLGVDPGPKVLGDYLMPVLKRLDQDDTYRLVYSFSNHDERTYHIRIWQDS